jgi:hypothetical protein
MFVQEHRGAEHDLEHYGPHVRRAAQSERADPPGGALNLFEQTNWRPLSSMLTVFAIFGEYLRLIDGSRPTSQSYLPNLRDVHIAVNR